MDPRLGDPANCPSFGPVRPGSVSSRARLHGARCGYSPAAEKQERISLIRTAVERGVTFFDTAETLDLGLLTLQKREREDDPTRDNTANSARHPRAAVCDDT